MKTIVALATCLALLIPGAAIASANSGSSSSCSYGPCSTSKVDHASASRTPSTTKPAQNSTSPGVVDNANATHSVSSGSLPFTGLDVGALAGGAVVLLGAGLVLRRASTADRK